MPLRSPQPLLTSDSPRRGGQSNWGWNGEHRASVTVRPHCRGPLPFPLGGLWFCVFFLLEEMEGRESLAWAAAGPNSTCTPTLLFLLCMACTARGLTEALLEPDSSSALGGCVAFFRLRGLDRAAFRRLLGGLVEESSYSSAREKRSLNLRERTGSQRVGVLAPWPSSHPFL